MQRLPGFRDFYPEPLPTPDVWSADARQYIFDKWRNTARRYGFREYDGPPLEPLELFTLKSGDEIVGQLYNFVDKGERAVALRPEMTPTLARMASAVERQYKKPLKWFAIPQLFRYEKQQKGRLREHFQLNADIIGESDVAADSELLALLIDTLRSFGLTQEDFVIRLSSRNAWQEFFAKRCADESKAYAFYQAVDKLERETPENSAKKFSEIGIALDEVTAFIKSGEPTPELQSILQNLSARGLGDFVKIDYGVIRGLAYYTGVVFEAFDVKGEFRAIAGGGRYNNLLKLISDGKVDLPALGFGMGDVVLLELLKARKLLPQFSAAVDVFVLIEDETLRSDSLKLIQELRAAGKCVEYSLTPAKADKQFKRALEVNASATARIERGVSGELTVRAKRLSDRQEQVLATGDAATVIGALVPARAER
ncbi:MAG TPA: ATP phosphoribosyltransferase regulatory subunit [Candidatus Acidoferrum sp.]|nr:ATP phosphoribosyltransferase regulatory subunit [Candidatus Acidoferrum sp.]